ncbi:hypothetical protein [Arabiibacter massiliensis]|uniref:hypothetical protein n=1 Tax=Arabiibacter massiliensis TaxID=1870985 RepID=UPI0009BB4604|nr:hypothetical protein [Arabiibacter massiliensis]
MIELIPSKDMRKHLDSVGREFTDFEKAELAYNNCLLPTEEKEQFLVELKATTEDQELVERIDRYFECKQQALRRFEEHEGFAYVLQGARFENRLIDGFFETREAAQEFARRACGNTGYEIAKAFLVSAGDARDIGSDALSSAVAALTYSPDHILQSWWSNESDEGLPSDESEKEQLFFDDTYFDIPHPFFRGDVVKVLGWDEVGIVLDPKDQEEKDAQVRRDSERKDALDFYDCAVTVEFPDEEGSFHHDHINPIYLEYATLKARSPEKMLIKAARNLLLGEGSLEHFQFVCKAYARLKTVEAEAEAEAGEGAGESCEE